MKVFKTLNGYDNIDKRICCSYVSLCVALASVRPSASPCQLSNHLGPPSAQCLMLSTQPVILLPHFIRLCWKVSGYSVFTYTEGKRTG